MDNYIIPQNEELGTTFSVCQALLFIHGRATAPFFIELFGVALKYKDVKNEKCTVKGLKSNTKYKFKIYALVSEKGKFAVQTPTNAFSFTTKAAKKAAEPFDDTLITL